jgi:hypothetical protein
MTEPYYTAEKIRQSFGPDDWQYHVFKEFESTLNNNTRPFPCVFGVAGLRGGHLRFGFSERMAADEVAPMLRHFVQHSCQYGKYTSLVVFARPEGVRDVDSYREDFWNFLWALSDRDQHPWPPEYPERIDDPQWEFCFAGEPMFVVCNTPAHVARQSRRASTFMLTFQPRWVFDDILGTPDAAEQSVRQVRSRLQNYGLLPPSPELGLFGDPNNKEFRQYFLLDDNVPASCPFHTLKTTSERPHRSVDMATKSEIEVHTGAVEPGRIPDLMKLCLPEQGCIELQHDAPGKEHAWHEHDTDETIIVLEGRLRFYWQGGEQTCQSGDAVRLPRGVRHGSVALDDGATYIITFEHVDL